MAKSASKSTKSSKSDKVKSKSNDSKRSLADLFDEADAAEASNLLSVGEHKVRLNKLEHKKDPKKGEAVRAEFEKLTGDEEGKKISQLYKLRDADNNAGPGIVYLKRDLALIGYEEVSGKKLLKTLEKITEEQPMVIIRVSQNGQYVNAFLQGLAEDGDDDDDNTGGDDEIEVGDNVKFTDDDGDEHEGEVVKLKGEKATVKVGKKEHKVDVGELEKVDEDDDDDDKKKDDDDDDDDKPKKKKGKKDDDDDDDDDDKKSDDDEIEVGDKVKGENEDGDDIEGEVVKIKGKNATVEDDEGDEHKCALSDLEKVDDDDDDDKKGKGKKKKDDDDDDDDDDKKGKGKKKKEKEIEVGDKVKFEDDDGDDVEGEVKKIKGDKLIVEDDDGDEHKVDKDDAELVDDDD